MKDYITMSKRGFTLVEVAVTLAVSVLALTLILTLIVNLMNCVGRTEKQTTSIRETNVIEVFVEKWFCDNDISGQDYLVSSNTAFAVDATTEVIQSRIYYSEVSEAIVINGHGSVEYQFKYVDGVSFEYTNGCLRVIISYNISQPDRVLYYTRRVSPTV